LLKTKSRSVFQSDLVLQQGENTEMAYF